MNTEIDTAIKNLTERINNNVDSGDALRYTQAALNLAHAKTVLSDLKYKDGGKV